MILIVLYLFYSVLGISQEEMIKSSKAFQEQMNESFRNPDTSPLKSDDLERFVELPFFEVKSEWIVKGKLKRTPNEKPFEMPTTTSRKPLYVKFGEISIKLEGRKFSLDVFQAVGNNNPMMKNYLFLPFTDRTSGVTTYGGGRYLEVAIPKGKKVIVNFNNAYHPYCAYNEKYSCPIVPEQNDLDIEVNAGVRL